MKNKIFLILFFITSAISSMAVSPWEAAYYKLTAEQKDKLELSIKHLLKETELGYVLFGRKPIYFGGFQDVLDKSYLLTNGNIQDCFFTQYLIETIQKCNVMGQPGNYFIKEQTRNWNKKIWHDVLIFNKKAFGEVIDQNLLLFQYVLGPHVTAQRLLEKLSDPNETLFSALNNDITLVGIVLGYGGFNSCHVAFECRLWEYLKTNRENIPLTSRKIIYESIFTDINSLLHHYNEKPLKNLVFPSFDFNCLKDESIALRKDLLLTTNLVKEKCPQVPHFGCVKSEETDNLLTIYQKDQTTIKQILKAGNLVEKFFARFAGKDSFPTKKAIPQERAKPSSDYSEILSYLFCSSIKEFVPEPQTCIKGFIKGLKSDQTIDFPIEFITSERKVKNKMTAKQNLQQANEYFKKLQNQKNLVSVVPNRLYYQILQEGSEKTLSSSNSKVSLFYKLSRTDEQDFKVPNWMGVKEHEALSNFIPGISKGLIGMKKNERRTIFMHPSYAYGENTTLEPNLGLMAEIELLDFEEDSSNEKQIIPHVLEAENYDIQQMRQDLKLGTEKIGEFLGQSCRNLLIKKPQLFDLQKIIRSLENQKNEYCKKPDDDFIKTLYWEIYLP